MTKHYLQRSTFIRKQLKSQLTRISYVRVCCHSGRSAAASRGARRLRKRRRREAGAPAAASLRGRSARTPRAPAPRPTSSSHNLASRTW